jgi:hypothetical protein
MPNLKEVRNRIVSVGSTMQITSAMKMVSAAKLKRAQDAVVQMRPYANKLKEILENVSASVDASENKFTRKGAVKNMLIMRSLLTVVWPELSIQASLRKPGESSTKIRIRISRFFRLVKKHTTRFTELNTMFTEAIFRTMAMIFSIR